MTPKVPRSSVAGSVPRSPASCVPRSPLAWALIAALSMQAAEILLALRVDNAVLNALPPGVQIRVFLLTLTAAILPAGVGSLVALAVLRRPRTARATAVLIAIFIPVAETLRHIDELRDGVPTSYWVIAAVLAAVLALAATVLPARSVPDSSQRPAQNTVSACVALAVCMVVLSAFGLPTGETVALAEGASEAPTTSPSPAPTDNLLVLLVDTLRADHLGCYGYARDTSPRIDAFAAESARFENAATPKPKTSPAIASLFTGLWPETHGIHSTSMVLPDEHVTLAETLLAAGFQTFGVAANVNISKRFGFDQGFQDFRRVRKSGDTDDNDRGSDGERPRDRAGKNAARVRDELFDWLEQREDGRFFAYVHFIDPHCPYTPPKEWVSRFRGDPLDGTLGVADARVGVDDYDEAIHEAVYLPAVGRDLDGYVARYDAEISYTDQIIGEILDELDRRGLRESTTVVFTADHGESMTEHHTWFNHGEHPYEEQVHIPLLVRGPGVAAGPRSEQVSLVGLMPTLLEVVGVRVPENIEGRSFAGRLADAGPPEDLAHAGSPTFVSARHGAKSVRGVRTNRWKFLTREAGIDLREALAPQSLLLPGTRIPLLLSPWRDQDLAAELYDLVVDPKETVNLAWRRPDERARLAALSDRHLGRDRPDVPVPVRLKAKDMGTDAAEELRQMGYLGGGDGDGDDHDHGD